MLHQRHLDFSSGIPASIAFHHWLSKQTDAPVKSSYHDYNFGEESYFNDDTFENRCYFNDGSAEDCYFIDNTEVCYFNDDQGVIKTPEAFKTLLLRIAGDQGPATPMLGPGLKSAPIAPQRSKFQSSLRRL